ncbi:MAG: hypothetical protein KDA92_16695 [Planctomycetales bacterium]|nr:hypothetical protein [Planctomycetales bacterium]
MSPTGLRRAAIQRYGSLLLLLSAFSTGCAHLPAGSAFPQWMSRDTAEKPLDSQTTCSVEFRGGSKDKTISVPVTSETRVQDVLEVSRATSKFRNLDVYILRATPQGPERALKMACRFDRKERRIGFESDYAVLPGDRVIVSEDHSSRFDQIMSSVVGPVMAHR